MPTWPSSTVFCSVLSSFALWVGAPVHAHDSAAMRAGGARLEVEIAETQAEREEGLMHRGALPENQGMWFVFDSVDIHCLWMKDTLIPLSAAFVADDGRVINIVDMAPLTLDPHCATAPARFVLEVNRGWFARHGIAPGDWLLPPPH